MHDAGKGVTERLENVDFQVAWPSISRSFGANGHFVWHDEPVEASLTLSDFLAALTGDRSGLKVRLSSAPLQLAFDGSASDQPTLKIDGTLGVESPSLRDALRWTGKSKLPFGGFGRFALRAQSDIGGGVASLSNVNVELDGNTAEGALTLSTDGHRLVQGTLAADALDLTPYVSGVRLLARNERNWNRAADRARRLRRFQSRSAALRRQHQDIGRAIGPHRGRRDDARRQARSHDRRSASLRRRRQGHARARQPPTTASR